MSATSDRRGKIINEAWIGDAVLGLYVRLKILRDDGYVDGEKYGRMTSNQFLTILGEPTEVEATVGRMYTSGGLEAAFAWIDERLLPHFDRQEAKRVKAVRPRYRQP